MKARVSVGKVGTSTRPPKRRWLDSDDDSDYDPEEIPVMVTISPKRGQPATPGTGNSTSPLPQIQWTVNDVDLLDCPICLSHLSSPIFQCENGHVACQQCCIKINNKCPSCSCPTGRFRCRWIERFLLESLKVSCKYVEHGCMEKMSYNVKSHHEDSCKHAPCSCPHDGCDYIGFSETVYTHFAEKHWKSSNIIHFGRTIHVSLDNNAKNVFLREYGQKTIFVLKHSVEPYGSLVNLVYIAPTSSKSKFSYELSAIVAENRVSYQNVLEPTPKLTPQATMGKCPLVPKYFANSNGRTELKLIIRMGVAER